MPVLVCGLALAAVLLPGPASAQPYLRSPCRTPIVWVDSGKVFFKDGRMIGFAPKSYATACNGAVVWVDEQDSIYIDERFVGTGAREYLAVPLTGDAVWLDATRTLWRNDVPLGVGAARFQVAPRTGDAVWIDVNGSLYRNAGFVGSAKRFELTPEGRIHWIDFADQHHID